MGDDLVKSIRIEGSVQAEASVIVFGDVYGGIHQNEQTISTQVQFDVKQVVRNFVGREQYMEDIRKDITKKKSIVVLSGLGGVGKSELARKYANDYSSDYSSVIWLNAAETTTVEQSIRTLHKLMGLKEKDIDPDKLAKEIYDTLAGNVLVIFDDAKDFESIQEFLPVEKANIHCLVTSNNMQWRSLRYMVSNIHIGDFSETEAVDFIKQALNITDDVQNDDIIELSRAMHFLPLALQHATSYIYYQIEDLAVMGKTFRISQYLEKYYEMPSTFVGKDFTNEKEKTIYKTMEITIEKIRSLSNTATAIGMLDTMAYMSPSHIPKDLLLNGQTEDEEQSINLLKRFSVIRQESDEYVSIHGLVQLVRILQLVNEQSDCYAAERVLTIMHDYYEKHEFLKVQKGNISSIFIKEGLNYIANYVKIFYLITHVKTVWNLAIQYECCIRKFLAPNTVVNRIWFEFLLDGEKIEMLQKIFMVIPIENFHEYISNMEVKNLNLAISEIIFSKGLDPNIPNDNDKCTALHRAAEQGLIEVVRLLTDLNAKVECVDANNKRAVHFAAENGHTDVVRFLVDVQNAKFQDVGDGKTPLQCAAENGHLEIVKYFAEEKHVDVNFKTNNGPTALLLAARGGHFEVVKYLVGDMKAFVDSSDEHEKTLLHYAAQSCNFSVIKYLIEETSPDVNAVDRIDRSPLHYILLESKHYVVTHVKNENLNNDYKPLEESVETTLYDVVKYLDEKNANFFTRDFNVMSPLDYAAALGDIATVRFISDDKGAYNASLDTFQTPLHMAAEKGHLIVVTYFVDEKHADVTALNAFRKTPLHLAAERGHTEVVKYLSNLCDGAQSASCWEGTPLASAAGNGHMEVVSHLIEVGHFDATIKNSRGQSAVHLAAEKGHLNIVEYLSKIMTVEDGDNSGTTPLHLAVANGHIGVVKYLISVAGNLVNATDETGQTALHLAAAKGNYDMFKILSQVKNANVHNIT